jgi:hypothetical protein
MELINLHKFEDGDICNPDLQEVNNPASLDPDIFYLVVIGINV